MGEMETVCVTGAGGYQASWLVKLLLLRGYKVHGTVRDPSDDEKNGHLKELEKASENLRLFKADLLDLDGLCDAIAGCSGVFHVASPVPSGAVHNPEVEFIGPAVEGTHNVLKASSGAKVKRVVMVSTISAIIMNPNWPKDQIMDETCWSDKEFCITDDRIKEFLGLNWYGFAKTEAEIRAFKYAKENGLDLVTVCPSLIIGPLLRPAATNAATKMLISFARDGLEKVENNIDFTAVDVRDVAEALLMVYEKPEANGRYICTAYPCSILVLVDKMKTFYPNLNYPKQISEQGFACKLSSEKLQKLGWKYRALEESIVDSLEDLYEKGLLDKKA